ncbi:MAG: hypothetical protein RPU73_02030 [Candidatus Sedimenticola sp. (ex Thyasira tokunagai)]
MSRVILVHGFNVADGGKKTIDRLIPCLIERRRHVVQYDYGYRFLLGVRLRSKEDARGLMDIYRPGDIVIGHSNGAHLIALAIEMGMPVKRAIMIHPALNKDWRPPYDHPIEEIHVYYSGKDVATWMAKFLPFHKWGAMGTVGPTSADSRLIGHQEEQSHSGGFVEHPWRYLEFLS